MTAPFEHLQSRPVPYPADIAAELSGLAIGDTCVRRVFASEDEGEGAKAMFTVYFCRVDADWYDGQAFDHEHNTIARASGRESLLVVRAMGVLLWAHSVPFVVRIALVGM
jgi:hypothetical protein